MLVYHQISLKIHHFSLENPSERARQSRYTCPSLIATHLHHFPNISAWIWVGFVAQTLQIGFLFSVFNRIHKESLIWWITYWGPVIDGMRVRDPRGQWPRFAIDKRRFVHWCKQRIAPLTYLYWANCITEHWHGFSVTRPRVMTFYEWYIVRAPMGKTR